MNLANIEYLQKRNEIHRTFRYYAAKVQAWMEKKIESEVVMEENGAVSYYIPSKREVHIREGAEARAYAHEFGHEFYHRLVKGYYNPIDVLEMYEWVLLLKTEEQKAIEDTLNSLGNKKKIRIFTDGLCCLGLDVHVLGYWGHGKDYKKRHGNDIAEDETFAEFFSVLFTEDWECFYFMINNFPQFVNSCFFAIDKGIAITA